MAFTHYKTWTHDHTQCGSADSTDFPIAVALTDADFATVANGGKSQNASGFDLRPFSDIALSVALTFQLVAYNAVTGALEMHVKVPTLSKTTDLVSYLGIGDAALSSDGSSTSTWDSGFKGVYHFKDGTTLSGLDATVNANNGSLINTPTAVAGRVDGAGNFVRASSQYVDLGNPASLQITGALTISAWINPATQPTSANFIIVGKDHDSGGRAYVLDYNDVSGSSCRVRMYLNGSTNGYAYSTTANLATSTWHFVAGVFTPSVGYPLIYIAGLDVTNGITLSGASIPSATASAFIARRAYSGNLDYFNGGIDEVRISGVARTPSWMLAEYNNQKASSTFLTWGTLTAIPVAGGPIVAGGELTRSALLRGGRLAA